MSRTGLRHTASLALLGAAAAAAAAAPAAPGYYATADFPHVAKIDAHVHVHGVAERLMAQASRDGFRLLTINVDYPDFPSLAEQRHDALSLRARYPDRVAFADTFAVEGFPSAHWERTARADIEAARAQGAVGIKVWKNIGMALQDPSGQYVMPDDPRLKPLFDLIEADHLVLLAHQAEPRNCWLPLEKMTVRSDQEYFREHPQYYMFEHPQMPSHEVILAARDRLLQAHPALHFDAVHLASLEWDVDRVAAFLERFPNAWVDVAARMVHLEYQAAQDRSRVRNFLVRFQDRILYGSDDAYGPQDSEQAAAQLHQDWLADWEFLTGRRVLHSADFAQPFQGLRLPREVVDKIYRRNAQALFGNPWGPAARRLPPGARGDPRPGTAGLRQ